jgi:hypothetical protein
MSSKRNKNGQFTKGSHWREPKPHWKRAWLYREYVTNQRSAKDIADECGCIENNILYHLHKHNIPRRTMKEVRAIKKWGLSGEANGMHGRTGKRNPNWKGGISPERQSVYSSQEWAHTVSTVWERDLAECQRCRCAVGRGITQGHIHHRLGFADEASRTNPDALVLLCRDCHRWVHSRKNKDGEFLGDKEGGEASEYGGSA